MVNRRVRSLGLLLTLIIIVASITGCTVSTTNQGIDASSIDMENALGIIEELSSTKYKGRLAGTPENEMAVDYIASYFKEIGLESPEGVEDYRQSFNQTVLHTESTPIIRIEDANGKITKELDFLKDYRIINIWRSVKLQGEATSKMVLINDKSQLHKDNKELEGKILLIDESLVANQNDAHVLLVDILELDKSIQGVIMNLENRRNDESYIVSTVTSYGVETFDNEEGPIVAFVTKEAFQDLKKAQQEEQNLHMAVDYSLKDVEVDNVIGVIHGEDKELKDEYIIITGHFDHVGDNKNGTYQPGALDNASGTAALMEIGKVLKESKNPPKKTIVFIAFNGEEEGLYGSQHYAYNDPIFPLSQSVVINMDMVGSKEIIPLTIGGSSRELLTDLLTLAKELGIDAKTDTNVASDQQPFNKKGVEAVTLIHSDGSKIHTPLDDMTNVDGDRLKEVIGFVLKYVEEAGY